MTKEYKTIAGFMKNNDVKQFTLDMFLAGRVYNKKHCEAIRFELEYSARKQACILFASAICSTATAKERYADYINNYYGKSYGIFRRLWIEIRSGNLYATYCAGQDYTGEIRTLQNCLRKG